MWIHCGIKSKDEKPTVEHKNVDLIQFHPSNATTETDKY